VFDYGFAYIRNEEGLMANMAITPFGADLQAYPSQGEGIWLDLFEDNAVITWKTSRYDNPDVDIEFAARIFENGAIDFIYIHDTSHSNNWVSGISKGDNISYLFSNISGSSNFPPEYHASFTSPDFPFGMSISEDGLFFGTVDESDKTWNITFKVSDQNYIYSTKTLEFSSAATGSDENNITPALRLYQNYPNPFNPSGSGRNPATEIMYQVSDDSKVELSVYNIKGQLINTLVNDVKSAGVHFVSWNGKDKVGIEVPSGIYFYRLSSEHQDISRKMILLK
jgi:hypothetical protein